MNSSPSCVTTIAASSPRVPGLECEALVLEWPPGVLPREGGTEPVSCTDALSYVVDDLPSSSVIAPPSGGGGKCSTVSSGIFAPSGVLRSDTGGVVLSAPKLNASTCTSGLPLFAGGHHSVLGRVAACEYSVSGRCGARPVPARAVLAACVHGRLCVLGRVLACEHACVVGRSTVFGRAAAPCAAGCRPCAPPEAAGAAPRSAPPPAARAAGAAAGAADGGGHACALAVLEREAPLPIARGAPPSAFASKGNRRRRSGQRQDDENVDGTGAGLEARGGARGERAADRRAPDAGGGAGGGGGRRLA